MDQEEPTVTMSTSPRPRPQFEDKLQEKRNIVELMKAEYGEFYKLLVYKLSTSHLESFAKILLQHEKCTLRNQEELIESFRQKLLKDLRRVNENFWEEFNVVDGLVAIEMLKDKFKEFEGTDWNVQDKTADQRTLPLRMCFKKAQMRTLEKQLQLQNAQLQEILSKNKKNRAQVQEVLRLQAVLREEMERYMQSLHHVEPEMDRCIQETFSFTAAAKRNDANEKASSTQ